MATDETKGAAPAAPAPASRAATVTLSDGRVATLRAAKGRDLEKGSLVSGAATQTALLMGIVSCITTIGGKGITYEDVQEMPLADVGLLLAAVGNDILPELVTSPGLRG
ncbi:MAG: hypothetical protein WD825_17355 [Gemmatimonadaceae bacterium]